MVTIGNVNTPEDIRRKWTQICRCSVGWHVVGVLALIVGILLMVFFVKYWNDMDRWERGLGYAGVAFLCLGILVVTIGVGLACILCYIIRRAENHKPFVPPKNYGLAGLYPRQPPAIQPSAPPPDESGHTNEAADIEMVDPQVKDKTF